MSQLKTIPGIGQVYRGDGYQTMALVRAPEDPPAEGEPAGLVAFAISTPAMALPVAITLDADELAGLIANLATARSAIMPCDCPKCRAKRADGSGEAGR